MNRNHEQMDRGANWSIEVSIKKTFFIRTSMKTTHLFLGLLLPPCPLEAQYLSIQKKVWQHNVSVFLCVILAGDGKRDFFACVWQLVFPPRLVHQINQPPVLVGSGKRAILKQQYLEIAVRQKEHFTSNDCSKLGVPSSLLWTFFGRSLASQFLPHRT